MNSLVLSCDGEKSQCLSMYNINGLVRKFQMGFPSIDFYTCVMENLSRVVESPTRYWTTFLYVILKKQKQDSNYMIFKIINK